MKQNRTRKQQSKLQKDLASYTFFNYIENKWYTHLLRGYKPDYEKCGDCDFKDIFCLWSNKLGVLYDDCFREATESEIKHQVRAVKLWVNEG